MMCPGFKVITGQNTHPMNERSIQTYKM